MAFRFYNIVIKQGADFRLTFTVENSAGVAQDVSGYTWAGQVRNLFFDASPAATFTFDTSGAASGVIVAQLTDTVTAALTSPNTLSDRQREDPLFGVYDIEGTDGSGTVLRYLQGSVTLSLEATQ